MFIIAHYFAITQNGAVISLGVAFFSRFKAVFSGFIGDYTHFYKNG
jgi:hypothetical protein